MAKLSKAADSSAEVMSHTIEADLGRMVSTLSPILYAVLCMTWRVSCYVVWFESLAPFSFLFFLLTTQILLACSET